MTRSTILSQPYLAIAITALLLTACGGPDDTAHDTDTDSVAAQQATIPDSVALMPGQSVGTFKLGDSDSLLFQRLGEPDFTDAAMGKAVLMWYIDTADAYLLSIFTSRDMGNDETARIQQIRVTSPDFKTGESLQVGSTLAEIGDHYQITAVETYEKGGQTYSVYDSDAGIAFEIGPDDRCVAIIIHLVDANKTTYLPLRPAD